VLSKAKRIDREMMRFALLSTSYVLIEAIYVLIEAVVGKFSDIAGNGCGSADADIHRMVHRPHHILLCFGSGSYILITT
jgi:hypothetical protein